MRHTGGNEVHEDPPTTSPACAQRGHQGRCSPRGQHDFRHETSRPGLHEERAPSRERYSPGQKRRLSFQMALPRTKRCASRGSGGSGETCGHRARPKPTPFQHLQSQKQQMNDRKTPTLSTGACSPRRYGIVTPTDLLPEEAAGEREHCALRRTLPGGRGSTGPQARAPALGACAVRLQTQRHSQGLSLPAASGRTLYHDCLEARRLHNLKSALLFRP